MPHFQDVNKLVSKFLKHIIAEGTLDTQMPQKQKVFTPKYASIYCLCRKGKKSMWKANMG